MFQSMVPLINTVRRPHQTTGTRGQHLNDDIRYKAAAAVVALANRAESAGKKDFDMAKGAQWVPMPYEPSTKINIEKLREAVAYYEIAESIFPAAAMHGYSRALLLESMGEWDEAIAAFRTLDASGTSGEESIGIKRCQEKKAGTYDELKFMGFSQEQIDAMDADDDDDPEPTPEQAAMLKELAGKSPEETFAWLDAMMKEKAAAKLSAKPTSDTTAAPPKTDGDDKAGDEAAAVALSFVNLLLDRDYAAASRLVHPKEKGRSAKALRESFEPMFEDEDFPSSANVYDVRTDMPKLGADGVAWVYVAIDSENAEAVSMNIFRHEGVLLVRNLEWGRA